MGRGGHGFLRHWHHRWVELPDGDVLRYLVIDEPPPATLECARTDRLGAVWPGRATELLAEVGHPDATLRLPDESASFGPRRLV